jgi:hypothetical protein
MFTTSELQELLGDIGGLESLVKKKLSGVASSLASVKAIQWGVTYEPVACALYEQRNGCQVHEFGLRPHPRIPRFGASPDGITDQGIMLEIKCPYTRRIDGRISKTYMTQIQTQLDTAELKECDFLECKIHEYESVEEYMNDEYCKDAALASNGMERGVVHGDTVIIENGDGAPIRYYGQKEQEQEKSLEPQKGAAEGTTTDETTNTRRPKLWRVDVYKC